MPQEYVLWSPLSVEECIRRLTEENEKMRHVRTFRIDRCRLVLAKIDEHGLTLYPALHTRLEYGTYFRGTFEPWAEGTIIRGDFRAHPLLTIPLLICGTGTVVSCLVVGLIAPIIIGVLLIVGDKIAQIDQDAYTILVLWAACSWTMPLFWALMGAVFALVAHLERPGYKQRISKFIETTLDARPSFWGKTRLSDATHTASTHLNPAVKPLPTSLPANITSG